MLKAEQAACEFLRAQLNIRPQIGLVLGTGLNGFAGQIEGAQAIPYQDIPNFPVSTAPEHVGQLISGRLKGRTVIAMQGRVHYYEGYSMQEVTFPIRVLRLLGVDTLFVTNAVGGINADYHVGELILLRDHIKFFNDTPLRGPNAELLGPRFPDMCDAYSKELRAVVKRVMPGIKEGVYAYMPGPCFETPAEIKMLRLLGADVVGMSTVPEVITAVHAGMRVVGISLVTNMAADLVEAIGHIQKPEESLAQFANLLCGVIEQL